MKKKILLMLAAVMALSSSVYASSTNYVSTIQHVKDGSSLAGESFHIEPHDEVDTGSSIIITFHGAVVFSQDVIDGTGKNSTEEGYNSKGYQYKVNGGNWNIYDGFYDVMPYTNNSQLPYSIKRLSDDQIQVYLCNLPEIYVDTDLYDINGSGRVPYYSIPLVAYADGQGEVTIDLDANDTSLSTNSGYKSNSNVKSTTETTTEATTKETATEASTEATTEADVNSVKVQIGSNVMYVNDKAVEIDAAPYIQLASSSTMVPLRAISEALYAEKDTVTWNASEKTVTIRYNGNVIVFAIGSDVMTVNGTDKPIANGVKAEIKDSRTFIPFRALGEALDAKVSWNANTKTATFN